MATVWKDKNGKQTVSNNALVYTSPGAKSGTIAATNKAKTTATAVPTANTGYFSPGVKSGTNPGSGMSPTSSGLLPINFDQYKSESASIADITKKYGIDYSREYAKRQAEAEAQAKRSGLEAQKGQIEEGVRNAQDALSRDYFQRGLAQAQSNVNGGINAGLANESNLRLSMNRQAEMGEIMGQANLARNEVARGLTDTEAARVAREEAIYNERLQQAIEVIQQDRSLDQNEKLAMMNAMLQQRGQDIDMDQFNRQMTWEEFMFNNISATDKAQQDWEKYMFNNISATDKAEQEWAKYIFNNMSATDRAQLDWSKYQFNNVSAADRESNRIAWAQLEEEKKRFATEQKWREYTYNNMSASERAQLNEDKKQFGEEMAWRKYELEYTSEMALAEAGAGLDFLP